MGRWTRVAALLGVAVLVMAACEPASPWRHELGNVDAAGEPTGARRPGTHDVSISADGTRIVFVTDADDLGPTDTNGTTDVYLRDLETGETTLVSVNDAGTDSRSGYSRAPQISADGTRVAFRSHGQGGPDVWDEPHVVNVYVRDLTTGTTVRASRNGELHDQDSDFVGDLVRFQLSRDGARVFSVLALPGFSPGWGYTGWNSYDIATGENTGGGYRDRYGIGELAASASPDGTYVAYTTTRQACSGPLDPETASICVQNVTTGDVSFVDHPAVPSSDFEPRFVDEPPTVAFVDGAGNLVRYDIATGTTEITDVPGVDLLPDSVAAIDADGMVTFTTDGGWVPEEVYVHHHSFVTGSTEEILAWQFDAADTRAAFDLRGDTLLMTVSADNLGPTDTNGDLDVYTYDLETGNATLVSANADHNDSGNGRSSEASISDDGRRVALHSEADDLGPSDTNGVGDVYVATLRTADVGVAATASPEPVTAGGTVAYEVEVTNDGPDAAENLRLGIVLPEEGADFADVSTTAGACEPPTSEQPNLVACSFGDAEPGAVATVTVDADVTAPSDSTLETVVVGATDVHDPDGSDDVVTVTSTVG